MKSLIRLWPWTTPKNRTIESYNARGHLRILCAAGGLPVTGEIEVQEGKQFQVISGQIESVPLPGSTSRWAGCPECNRSIRVTGPKSRPRLTVHNAAKHR